MLLRARASRDVANSNRAAWGSNRLTNDYASRNDLDAAERAILAIVSQAGTGKRILDLGVGAGRTTPYLLALSNDYVGVDFAPCMVAKARESNPGVDIRCGDARDLSEFSEASFSFVLFSFNGIDYVAFEDRKLVLQEVFRVLEPGAYFAFSTHNLRRFDGRVNSVYRFPPFALSANPARLGVRLARWGMTATRSYRNYRRLRPLEEHGDGYAIYNDGFYDYAVLTCYIDPQVQCAELAGVGFDPPKLFERDGEPGTISSMGPWLYYLARKP
jgi:SAM-dependent methyltransferase